MAKIEYQYLRFSTFKKFLVFLLFISIIIIVPKIVNAYGGGTIYCHGAGSCGLSDCHATLYCPDNQPGYNVQCRRTGETCHTEGRDGPCSNMHIEDCEYVPIVPACNCSSYGQGWHPYPDWGGCNDCTTNPVDWNNACAPCGQTYAYCDGCNWDTNWNNHKCAGSPKTCTPNQKVCNPLDGGTGSDVYQCDSGGCSSSFNEDCGFHYWTDQYQCSGTMQQRLYKENGCKPYVNPAYCFHNDWWIDNLQCPTPSCTAWVASGCSGTSIQESRTCYTATCTGAGVCGSTPYIETRNTTDCGGPYYGTPFCSGTRSVYYYYSRGCGGGSCYNNPILYDYYGQCPTSPCTAWAVSGCSGNSIQESRTCYSAGTCTGNGICGGNNPYTETRTTTNCGGPYDGTPFCSGTISLYYHYSRGCSGGGCYNNPTLYPTQCPTPACTAWVASGCSGTSILETQTCYTATCAGAGVCGSTPYTNTRTTTNCGSDYWGTPYCSGTTSLVYYYSKGCSGGGCYNNPTLHSTQCPTPACTAWVASGCSGTSILETQTCYTAICAGAGVCGSTPYTNTRTTTNCGTDYWTNNYRCVGTMQQRQYVSRGCSGGGCYSNTIWYDWSQCGSDYWGINYSCSSDLIWRTRQYFSRGCSGVSCYLTPSYQNWENCNTYDGWYGSQLRDYYCSAGACVYSGNTIPNVPTLTAPPNNTWINYDPTFQATVSDPDNNQVRAYFEILGYGSAYSGYVSSGQTASYGPANIATCYQNYWRAYAQDLGGLTSGWTGYWLYSIDKSTPTNSISYTSGTIKTTQIPVTLTESDPSPCSGINTGDVEVRISKPNGNGWGTYQDYSTTINDFTYTGTDKYTYQFRYRVMDNAGNWSGFVVGGTVLIDLNNPPTATGLHIDASSPCTIVPSYTFNWTYSDPDSDHESRFDFEVDNNSNFSSPEISRSVNNLDYPSGSSNSQATTLVTSPTSPGCNYLTYNTTYYWRTRVYDSSGTASAWVSGSNLTTLVHHYPSVDFTWTPNTPVINATINLIDNSRCWDEDPINGSDCSIVKRDSYQWTMTGGVPSTAITENAITKYATLGLKNITLQVTDSDAHTCSVTKSLRANYPLPTWREIIPF